MSIHISGTNFYFGLNFREFISTFFKARVPSGAWAALLLSVMLVAESRLQTSPPQTYITSYLPKLLLSALPLSMIGCLSDKRIRSLLIPPLGLTVAISNLGHKEWRFIIYVIPIFNIAASRGAKWMQVADFASKSLLT